jgi:hypothetical protein
MVNIADVANTLFRNSPRKAKIRSRSIDPPALSRRFYYDSCHRPGDGEKENRIYDIPTE